MNSGSTNSIEKVVELLCFSFSAMYFFVAIGKSTNGSVCISTHLHGRKETQRYTQPDLEQIRTRKMAFMRATNINRPKYMHKIVIRGANENTWKSARQSNINWFLLCIDSQCCGCHAHKHIHRRSQGTSKCTQIAIRGHNACYGKSEMNKIENRKRRRRRQESAVCLLINIFVFFFFHIVFLMSFFTHFRSSVFQPFSSWQ